MTKKMKLLDKYAENFTALREMVDMFTYELGGDSNRLMRDEMLSYSLLDDDEEIEWTSPLRDFKFRIERNELMVNVPYNPDGTFIPNYLISVKIYNYLGTQITELRFSEYDAIRILSAISDFVFECRYNSGNSSTIYINPNNTNLQNHIIYLENDINPDTETQDFRLVTDEPYILFQIQQYSSIYENIISLVTMRLNFQQIHDLAFHLFFETIINIDFPTDNPFYEELEMQLENVEDFIMTDPISIKEAYVEKLSQQYQQQVIYQPLEVQPIRKKSTVVMNLKKGKPINK